MLRFLLLLSCLALLAAAKPDLLLAQWYDDTVDVKQYWVSEKLDGVRAYWDGHRLQTRGGELIHAPAWFLAGLPKVSLDGELWIGRDQFANTMSTVSKLQPIDSEWQQVRYHVFELPHAAGTFSDRIDAMQALFAQSCQPNVIETRAMLPIAAELATNQQNARCYWQVVPQFRLRDTAELLAKLHELSDQGAEGLMLHQQDALYKTGRSSDLLKLKTYQDTEAEVVGYRPGKGKYQGMVGALVVKMPDGRTFAIGSGLTDAQRQNPPPLGAQITYRYNGFTNKGLPRFARFLRVRTDE